jgi:hypothetical protein
MESTEKSVPSWFARYSFVVLSSFPRRSHVGTQNRLTAEGTHGYFTLFARRSFVIRSSFARCSHKGNGIFRHLHQVALIDGQCSRLSSGVRMGKMAVYGGYERSIAGEQRKRGVFGRALITSR